MASTQQPTPSQQDAALEAWFKRQTDPYTATATERLKRAALLARILRQATQELRSLPADKPVRLDKEEVDELLALLSIVCEELDIRIDQLISPDLTPEQQQLWDAAAVPNEEGYCSEEQCRLSDQWRAEAVVAGLRYVVKEAGALSF